MASKNPRAHEKVVRKSKEDTWKADELTKELRKTREVDKKKIRSTEKMSQEQDRTKEKNPFKEISKTSIKDTEIRKKQDEKNREIKQKKSEEGQPKGKLYADKSKERVLKETQSPRSSHSPKLKNANTGSPFDKRKERDRLLDMGEKTSSPLSVRKSDHDKKKLKNATTDFMGSPLHTRKEKNRLLGKAEVAGSPRNDRKTDHRKDEQKKKMKGEQERTAKGHNSSEQLKPEVVTHRKQKEIKEELEGDTIIPMEEVIEDIGQQEEEEMTEHGYSDDQFEEDYEEDFDDIESSDNEKRSPSPLSATDINNIMQAIDSENQNVDQLASPDNLLEPSAPSSHSFLSPRPKISFTSSSSNQSVRSSTTRRKMYTRADELGNLITIDVMAANLFELNPQSEYDFYMRSFGTSNTHQTSTQTGYDHEESDAQTDDVSTRDIWTQCPPCSVKEYGGSGIDDDIDAFENGTYLQYNSESLLKFIERAGKVVIDLLDEEEQYSSACKQDTSTQYSDAYCSLRTSFGSGGHITCIDWRMAIPNMYLLGYEDNTGVWGGSLELWNAFNSSNPQYCLGNHSVPTSCCLLFPLVVSGNEDGSIVLWDLREPLSMHSFIDNRIENDNKLNRVYRVATFTTAALGWDSGHCEPVLCLSSTSSGSTNTVDWQDYTVKGLSSQLLSIDSSGKVCVWVVVEVFNPDPAGSDTDLGLVPGGKIKLIANSSFRIFDPSLISPSISFVCIKDINSNELLIGTDNGNVVCHVRYKSSSSPKVYSLRSIKVNQNVTSISIHPTSKRHFLVGYSTGHVALYHSNKPEPLIQWPSLTTPVHSLHWHPELPSVFIGLWQHTEIQIWDLLRSDAEPVHRIKRDNKLLSALPVFDANSKAAIIVYNDSGLVDMYHLETLQLSHNNCKELIEDYFTTLF